MRSSTKGVPYANSRSLPGAVFMGASCSAKLSPIALVETRGKKRPIPQGPFCSSTYVSIRSTCPSSCAFMDNGCYAQNGTSRRIMQGLDGAEREPAIVVAFEATLIGSAFGSGDVPQDGARGGRDLRLHVGGDSPSEHGAKVLALAARTWRERGGGAVWTYTHRWRDIPRAAWGEISVWASCETLDDAFMSMGLGYRASLVVDSFASDKRYPAERGRVSILPCPFETRGVTCVKCRLCLDAPIDKDIVIGFRAHGEKVGRARAAINKRRLEVVS